MTPNQMGDAVRRLRKQVVGKGSAAEQRLTTLRRQKDRDDDAALRGIMRERGCNLWQAICWLRHGAPYEVVR